MTEAETVWGCCRGGCMHWTYSLSLGPEVVHHTWVPCSPVALATVWLWLPSWALGFGDPCRVIMNISNNDLKLVTDVQKCYKLPIIYIIYLLSCNSLKNGKQWSYILASRRMGQISSELDWVKHPKSMNTQLQVKLLTWTTLPKSPGVLFCPCGTLPSNYTRHLKSLQALKQTYDFSLAA